MTYVTEQTSAELRAHMRRLQAMPGWHTPLDDRLFKEVVEQDKEIERLRAALTQPTTVQQAEPLLTEWEQKAVLADPMGLACLINYHDCQEAGADAMESGAGKGNERRALELLKLGREIIARDPEIWDDIQKRAFALRRSERAALKNAPTAAPGDAR